MLSCDIIIPVWNQLECTKECIDSIKRSTRYPYTLIIVDNASDDETRKYLEALKKSDKNNVVLIRNEKNEGFVKAVNKGIRFDSKSEFVCVLNNDTIVTTGWLNEMSVVAKRDASVGIVNPSSNTLGQALPSGVTPEEFQKASKNTSGSFVKLGGAFGFCMFIKRELFKKIGYFDEKYGMGYFEDADFSLRAKEAGYKSVRALAAYVYHEEKKSFSVLPKPKKSFDKNKKIFEEKWGKTKRVAVVLNNINDESTAFLDSVLEANARENSWVYIISPRFNTEDFFKKYSNLTFYHYKRFFNLSAFFKIFFKKKRPYFVYSDNKILSGLVKIAGFQHGVVREKTS